MLSIYVRSTYSLFAFWVGILKESFKFEFLNISLKAFIQIQYRIAELIIHYETHWLLKRETLEINHNYLSKIFSQVITQLAVALVVVRRPNHILLQPISYHFTR